jgi:hypothetical protein
MNMMADVLREYKENGIVIMELEKFGESYSIGMVLDYGSDNESYLGETIGHDSPDSALLYVINDIEPAGTVRMFLDCDDVENYNADEIYDMAESGKPLLIEIKMALN